MFIDKGESEFEVSLCESNGEWEGRIVEYNLSRVTPTLHLCHSWTSLEAAMAGVERRWKRLFPDEETPDFGVAISVSQASDAS